MEGSLSRRKRQGEDEPVITENIGLSLVVDNERGDARRDGQTCLARPILRHERGQGNYTPEL